MGERSGRLRLGAHLGDGEARLLELVFLDNASDCCEGTLACFVRLFRLRFAERLASFHALCSKKGKCSILGGCGGGGALQPRGCPKGNGDGPP